MFADKEEPCLEDYGIEEPKLESGEGFEKKETFYFDGVEFDPEELEKKVDELVTEWDAMTKEIRQKKTFLLKFRKWNHNSPNG